MTARAPLGEILVRLRALSPSDVPRVLDVMRRSPGRTKFGQTARAMGLITQEDIMAALAVQMNLLPDIAQMTMAQIIQALGTANVA